MHGARVPMAMLPTEVVAVVRAACPMATLSFTHGFPALDPADPAREFITLLSSSLTFLLCFLIFLYFNISFMVFCRIECRLSHSILLLIIICKN